jgi:hypothetical protein
MKINQIISEMTAGCVSSVAMPVGATKKRTTETVNVPGLKPASDIMKGKAKKKGPYANSLAESKKVEEAKLDEDDLIIVPGQGMKRRTGFIKHDPDKAEHEGQTLKNSLHTIIRVATHLNKELSVRDNFPEWVSEKIGAVKSMMVTVMDYIISDKEMNGDISTYEMAERGVDESIVAAGSYNPLDQERQEQDAMDWSKRQFKDNELQGELGHEDKPNFERNRNRGPFYIKINGKILRTRGEIKVFDYLNGARNYGSAILKKKPELKGKVFITNSPKDDEQGVAEGSTKSLMSQYRSNEHENNHSENIVLLAKHFGTPEELAIAQEVIRYRDEKGGFDYRDPKVKIYMDFQQMINRKYFPQLRSTRGVAEGAKVDRMVKHIAKSEREAGKSSDEAEDIAWATANKRGYLDNKNKKKH